MFTSHVQVHSTQQQPPTSVLPASGHGTSAGVSEAPRLKMVGWYDPRQLISTGAQVVISTIFGRHSDHRLVEALAASDEAVYDYSYDYHEDEQELCEPDHTHPRTSIWIDYVGDVGDGWNSTYAVAYSLAQPTLTVQYTEPQSGETRRAVTQRGDILIFGGDQVYPTASSQEYRQRLLGPYETALRETKAPPFPHAFAIPGNHDWYDSLVSFTRFFTSRRWFGGWRTRQSRSYFALKLPHGWWLLGTDVQLGSDIDRPQVDYFKRVAEAMQPDDRIILCHAEPHWIYAKRYEDLDATYNESNLAYLERQLGTQIAVFIAGDLHHYRRHEHQAQDGALTEKITAGGGGAFLHPTHPGRLGERLDELEEKKAQSTQDSRAEKSRVFRQRACFPDEKRSRRLAWRNLIFPYLPDNASWTFGFVPAALYWLTTLAVVTDLGRFDALPQGNGSLALEFIGTALSSVLHSPLTLLWALVTLLGFALFTDTHSVRYRLIMGPLHGLTHVLAAFGIALGSIYLVVSLTSPDGWILPLPCRPDRCELDLRVLVAWLPIIVGGFIVGSFIMGLYLLVSLNVFGRHSNEAFSSLAIQDWKHFLRLHIDEQGDLTIYPIGIRRVPRHWKAPMGETVSELVPDEAQDPQATKPELIEPPIILRRPKGAGSGVTASSRDGQPHGHP